MYHRQHNNKPEISIMHTNIRSITKNFIFIESNNNFLQNSVIALSECWITKDSHIPQLHSYNSSKVESISNKSGGVIAYVKNNMPHKHFSTVSMVKLKPHF